MMLAMLRDLLLHKGHVDASLIKAIRSHAPAESDQELRRLLHHILVANRFWLMLSMQRPFALEEETAPPDSLASLTTSYRETYAIEQAWLAQVQESDLNRCVESSFFPGSTFTVAQGLMQVCMHSHGHRSQCATRLRMMGGTPPVLDFILWLKDRRTAEWS